MLEGTVIKRDVPSVHRGGTNSCKVPEECPQRDELYREGKCKRSPLSEVDSIRNVSTLC